MSSCFVQIVCAKCLKYSQQANSLLEMMVVLLGSIFATDLNKFKRDVYIKQEEPYLVRDYMSHLVPLLGSQTIPLPPDTSRSIEVDKIFASCCHSPATGILFTVTQPKEDSRLWLGFSLATLLNTVPPLYVWGRRK